MKIIFELFLVFCKIGAFTFGGGYAMLPYIEHECVEKRRWLTDEQLLELTAVAESTPGPIAINCATYVGYRQGKLLGSVAATFGVVLPSFLIILLLSSVIEKLMQFSVFQNAFRGIRVAVGLLILFAGVKMFRKMKKSSQNPVLSIIFCALFFVAEIVLSILNISFSTVYFIVAAAIGGFLFFFLLSRKEKMP